MADYYVQFSCMFDVGPAENAARAEEIRCRHAEVLDDVEGVDIGFDMKTDPDSGPGALWISSDGHGEPEHVIAFVLACAHAFDLKGLWGFAWSLSCSKPRLESFGGGAQVLDLALRKSLAWTDCSHWLADRLNPVTGPVQAPVEAAPHAPRHAFKTVRPWTPATRDVDVRI